MSLTTPLRQVLGLGSAKSGVHHWWLQRLTSIALVPLSIWFAGLAAVPALARSRDRERLDEPGADRAAADPARADGDLALAPRACRWSSRTTCTARARAPCALVLSGFAHVFLAAAGVFAILKVAFGGAA